MSWDSTVPGSMTSTLCFRFWSDMYLVLLQASSRGGKSREKSFDDVDYSMYFSQAFTLWPMEMLFWTLGLRRWCHCPLPPGFDRHNRAHCGRRDDRVGWMGLLWDIIKAAAAILFCFEAHTRTWCRRTVIDRIPIYLCENSIYSVQIQSIKESHTQRWGRRTLKHLDGCRLSSSGAMHQNNPDKSNFFDLSERWNSRFYSIHANATSLTQHHISRSDWALNNGHCVPPAHRGGNILMSGGHSLSWLKIQLFFTQLPVARSS